MGKKHIFLFLLILGTAFWGISFSLVKIGISNQSPFVFLFYKFLIAAISLVLVFHRQLRYVSMNTLRIAALTAAPLLIGTILQTVSLKHTSVTNSAFITGLDVALIPILKFLVYRKAVRTQSWIACGIAMIGLAIITVQDGLRINMGDLGTLVCAFGFAFYVLQVGKYSNEEHAMPSVILLLSICAIGCGLAALIYGAHQWVPENMDFWKGALFAALPATAYMYAVQNMAQRYLQEEQVGLTYLCEPIFATLTGIILLDEIFNIRILLGGAFVLASMLIAEMNFGNRSLN